MGKDDDIFNRAGEPTAMAMTMGHHMENFAIRHSLSESPPLDLPRLLHVGLDGPYLYGNARRCGWQQRPRCP